MYSKIKLFFIKHCRGFEIMHQGISTSFAKGSDDYNQKRIKGENAAQLVVNLISLLRPARII